jgi:hypothetical protein
MSMTWFVQFLRFANNALFVGCRIESTLARLPDELDTTHHQNPTTAVAKPAL